VRLSGKGDARGQGHDFCIQTQNGDLRDVFCPFQYVSLINTVFSSTYLTV